MATATNISPKFAPYGTETLPCCDPFCGGFIRPMLQVGSEPAPKTLRFPCSNNCSQRIYPAFGTGVCFHCNKQLLQVCTNNKINFSKFYSIFSYR